MNAIATLGFLLGTAFASGLNLYATVAALGLLQRFGVVQLPPSLEVLAHPVVLILAIALYAIEFVADKIPYVDSIWDVIHTFIRPPAAALIAYGAVADIPESWGLGAALIAGSVALTSHGTKASARIAINASPEPFSNSVVSLAEDGVALTLSWLAAAHPYLTTLIVLLLLSLSIYVIYRLFGLLSRAIRRLFTGTPAQPAPSG